MTCTGTCVCVYLTFLFLRYEIVSDNESTVIPAVIVKRAIVDDMCISLWSKIDTENGREEKEREDGKKVERKSLTHKTGSSFSLFNACVRETYRERFGQWISLRNIIVTKLCLVAVLEYGAVVCVVCGPNSLLVRFVARMRIFQPWAVRIIVPFMINRFSNGVQHTIWFKCNKQTATKRSS